MKLLSFFLIFLSSCIINAGFPAGTLVKTPYGHKPIESLAIGDTVHCCFSEHANTITHIQKKSVNKAIVLELENIEEPLIVSCTQKFYVPEREAWVFAQDLTPRQKLIKSNAAYVLIKNVHEVSGTFDIYDISVQSCHTFFVSRDAILVHNFLPIVLTLTWLFGSGTIEFIGASLGVALLGGIIGYALYKKTNHIPNFTCEIREPSFTGDTQFEMSILERFEPLENQRSAQKNYSRGQHRNGSSVSSPKMASPCMCGCGCLNPFMCACSCGCPCTKKERKINTMSKQEFFRQDCIKENYEHYRDGVYRLKENGKAIVEGAYFLKWDYLHADVEVYNKSEAHLGSLDPQTLKLYKNGASSRKI